MIYYYVMYNYYYVGLASDTATHNAKRKVRELFRY